MSDFDAAKTAKATVWRRRRSPQLQGGAKL